MSLEAHVVAALSHDTFWSTVHIGSPCMVVERHETQACALAHVKQAGGIVLPPSIEKVESRKVEQIDSLSLIILAGLYLIAGGYEQGQQDES